MKAILMSIKSRFAQLILGKTKTIEIRKRFPKDFKGRVYIYHTKAKNPNERLIPASAKWSKENDCSGKVVARFWCDNVGVIELHNCLSIPTIAYTTFADKYYSDNDLQVASCLNGNELMRYLGTDKKEVGFAIPISDLEIFDKPKELNEFKNYNMVREVELNADYYRGFDTSKITVVKKAPQSWFYVEVKE